MNTDYRDFAIILTWPDATIRGDEKWMMFFKKIGLVKNLNFKVGHTGVVIVNHQNGEMYFYDFGRYITPRGYGRARSKNSDPLLDISMKAVISNNKIANIEEIIRLFEDLKPAMYGDGKLYFSIVEGINFEKAKAYGDECVEQGTFPYGAVAKNNNNCSRFITRMLMKSSTKYHFWHYINLPETIKSSPVSNLVNTAEDRIIYSYLPDEGIKSFKMNRFQSFWFLVKQLSDNVSHKKSALFPNDLIIGGMNYRSKPITLPKEAMYLGGVGDGAWYTISSADNINQFIVKRFASSGKLEYVVLGESVEPIDLSTPYQITYDSHLLFTHIEQNNKKIRINHLERLENDKYDFENIKERYA
ncbi:DUF6695 family protein [Sphingobacterium bovistauri]|uniref:Uncharacterized protein n=1 Tax=Sphingobacterium bovistauri TaxID=2781959 RepID=A0ABS7Z5L3_9SPHI|nr:DUF6695 family protein [Sphingobacterium bovistauri]MCA5004165.1 hypothetical protein [Sphingobacterium bovistauri]